MSENESTLRLLAAVNSHTSGLGEHDKRFSAHVSDVACVIAENYNLKDHIKQLQAQLTSENKTPVPFVHPQTVAGPFDQEGFLDLVKRSYGWTVFTNGEIAGLVAGDMGYDGCVNPVMLGDLVSHAILAGTNDNCDEIGEALGSLVEKCSQALIIDNTYRTK